MANTLLTPTAVTRESLRILHQKLNFVGSINRQYDDRFAQDGAKIGDTLKIRMPNRYSVTTGRVMVVQDTAEESVDLKVDTQKHVAMNFTSVDLTLSLQDFSKRIINPAMSVLAANIEYDVMSLYKDIYQQVNNTGAAATLAKLLAGRKQLQDALAPMNDRSANLNTQDNVDLIDGLKALFQDDKELSRQYREGRMGRAVGFDFMENSLWPRHLRGAANTSYTTDTRTSAIPIAATPVSTITVAAGSGAINVGDVFTIANVFRVHPETKAVTADLQQFTVTAAYGGGAGDISITPSIIMAGAKQNVSIPTTASGAGLTFAGTASAYHGISMLYQEDAFTFATADLDMPKGVDFASRQVFDGISMRIVRQYDINNDALPCRVDVLYGKKTLRPELATRFANN